MDDDDLDLGMVFTSPPSPPPPAPTVSHYERALAGPGHWKHLFIRLVGSHPLWGHHLWNAARCFATYLDRNANELCVGQNILELGAGGGLPGLVAALCGARKVVLTDYPDEQLTENLRINVENNIHLPDCEAVEVKGYIWGRPVADLLSSVGNKNQGFDLILMSDLIFNHSQHDALLQTAEACLTCPSELSSTNVRRSPACVLVFYTHHRPHLAQRDLELFTKARARGWTCEEIITEHFNPMFPEDSGDVAVRSAVHGWRLTRACDRRE